MILDRLKSIPVIVAISLVNILFRYMKVETTWLIGDIVGAIGYRIMPKRRAIIDNNMRIVAKQHPEVVPSPALSEAIFRRNVSQLACTLKTYGMTPEQLSEHITIHISTEYQQAILNNSGAVLCLAHMGNWEILTKISSLLDPEPKKFGAVYRPLDSKAADRYVAQQREEYHCQMFPKSTSPSKLANFIRNGGILGVLADQRSGGPKNTRPFFGIDSARSKLPAILHLRTQAPLFSLSLSSPEPGQWLVEILPVDLSKCSAEPQRDEVIDAITASYEKSFSKHLLDVFWLHRYWA
ncbi:lysophospholipid acyltransferase family protein [Rubritalea marina]|uniref:lysophospholipid acyltransferase family protein n=1 Tax=Rubritalea marina TaxID=361055 RepID=UPI00037E5231|nr:lysophospholipid acyltransferase family protein [Rubritalea marina]